MNDFVDRTGLQAKMRDTENIYWIVAGFILGVGFPVIDVVLQSLELGGMKLLDGFIVGLATLIGLFAGLQIWFRRAMAKYDFSYRIRHLSVFGTPPAKSLERRILR